MKNSSSGGKKNPGDGKVCMPAQKMNIVSAQSNMTQPKDKKK